MAFRERKKESIQDEPKRLSDFLRESDDELLLEIDSKCEFRNKAFKLKWGSGLNRLGKLLWFGRRGKIKKEDEKKDKVMKCDLARDCSSELCNMSVTKSGNASVTLGMGIGLYLLLSKSTSENSKMTDLHNQMKTLLEEIKKEFENKSRVCGFCSTTSDLSCGLHTICDEETKCDEADTQCVKMDRMEAELEIELERMKSNVSEGSSALMHEEERSQVQTPGEWVDFCQNFGSNLEKFDETWEDDCIQNYGVSPHELERKLHELLHQRHQGRIEELEYHLHFLERQLLEKECEIDRWKDIATISSKCE